MKTVAVFLADGFEMIEALSPVDYLTRAGAKVILVSVQNECNNEKNNEKVVTSSHNVKIICDISLNIFLDSYNENQIDCIFFPGGANGSINLSKNQKLLDFATKMFVNNRIVSAICASPAVVLAKTNILENKKWTCYPKMENEVDQKFLKNHKNKRIVIDQNLITGKGPGTSEEFSMVLVNVLFGSEICKKIKESTIQR